MAKIKFGTDGWRAIIADDFTVSNLARMAVATSRWIKRNHENPSIVVGHDCRFGGPLFAQTISKVFCEQDIHVYLAEGFVSTPMVSYGVVAHQASAGIVITASHNPPAYNGYKVRGHYGGPALTSMNQEIESLLPDETYMTDNSIEHYKDKGRLELTDLEQIYCDHAEDSFDLEAIRQNVTVGFDAMYGAAQNVLPRLLPDAHLLHCEENPTFKGQPPEPIHKNLLEFSQYIQDHPEVDCGIATDGDGDRIGMYDGKGNFVDSHHIILLLIHYLCKYKKMSGKVVVAFSVTEKVKQLCKHYDLPVDVVPIGFKYIAEIMTKEEEDVLLGGEESGGIATKSHIPERDGVWMGLTLLEFMAKEDKTINDLIQEVYEIVGRFHYLRDDLKLDEEVKQDIMKQCENDEFSKFGNYRIERVENIDGYKFFLGEDEWVMIRPSGTEPVLRVYAEASDQNKVEDIIKKTKDTILPEKKVKQT